MSVLALAGGVGGAKLATGLAGIMPPGTLTIAVNTGDDFTHLGLTICPDIDSVSYALAGRNDMVRGWGMADESWSFMAALRDLGGEDWFNLGDRDLATHVLRTHLLRDAPLSAVTATLTARLGISQAVVPMSDDRVASIIESDRGDLNFQDYFVRYQCAPRFHAIRFEGAAQARPAPAILAAFDDPALEAIILCPSNPILSIGPILSVPGMRERIVARRVPCVALSPFIAGQAVKGPAAKIMGELGLAATPTTVAAHYAGLIDGLVVDHADLGAGAPVGVALHGTDIMMRDPADQQRLAREVMAFARTLAQAGP